MTWLQSLQHFAQQYGLKVEEKAPGHFHIKGGSLLVNYYPTSKSRSAYVAGTQGRRTQVSPQQACQMALVAPPEVREMEKRKKNYRAEKMRLLRRSNRCHWCRCLLSLDGEVRGSVKATLEHIIPLKRGGLDNANNRTLACEPCNNERGHEMPEIAAQDACK